MFTRVKRLIDNFTETIKAGYYTPATLENPQEEALPRKPWVLTAVGIFSIGYAFATNTVIGLAIEASLVGVTAGIGLAAVAAGGLLGALYLKSKKAAKERIFETNMAGQRVKGTRTDLYKLNQAQRQIISLTESFKSAAAPRVVDAEVKAVIEAHEDIRQRVNVLDPGDAPGGEKTYEFVRPVVEFTNASAKLAPEPKAESAPKKPAAKKAAKPNPRSKEKSPSVAKAA